MTLIVNTGSITTSNMNKIATIQATDKKVFSAQDLAVLWGYSEENKLFELIKYYVKTKQIFALTRGLYSKNRYTEQDLRNEIDLQYEIANKLVPNSYVSLWTVLKNEGVVFQYYGEIYSVAARSVTRTVLGVKFVYKQVKESVLLNDLGILKVGRSRVATVERALGDMTYLFPNIKIDQTGKINKELLADVGKIYVKSR